MKTSDFRLPTTMSNVSLLPENLREKEKKSENISAPQNGAEMDLKMHVPQEASDEDIEIIEVDEGDLAAVLSDEPFMTRFTYKVSLFIDQLREKMLHTPRTSAPPAKTPPQFFKPPKTGLVTATGAIPGKPGETPKTGVAGQKARIMPSTEVPRRVRVIRRIRKPVRISLASPDILQELSVDVARRKWTLSLTLFSLVTLIGTGYYLLHQRIQTAQAQLATVDSQLGLAQNEVDNKLKDWSQFQDLEERLRILSTELNSHIISSRLFSFLEANTLPSVRYKSASWADDGKLSLDVVTDTFEHAAGQVMIMKNNPDVKTVSAASFSSERDDKTRKIMAVTFQLQLELKPGIFAGPAVRTDMLQSASSTSQGIASPTIDGVTSAEIPIP
jgi:hypothetical protein